MIHVIHVIHMIYMIHVISVIVHGRWVDRRHRRADGTHDEVLGGAHENSEVVVLQVQVRVHEDRQFVREDPQIPVSVDLLKRDYMKWAFQVRHLDAVKRTVKAE